MTQLNEVILKILSGTADKNIKFDELRNILLKLGFNERIKGSHHIFFKDNVEEIINIQPLDTNAKAYQVKQIWNIISKYKWRYYK